MTIVMTAPQHFYQNQSIPPPPPRTAECVVCYETFAPNDDVSSFSRCPACDHSVCFACFETHQRVTGRGLHDVRCVSCNEPWPDRDLYAWLQQHPGAEARFAYQHGTLHHLRTVENTYMAETHKLMRYEDDVHTTKHTLYEALSREVADMEHDLRIRRYRSPPTTASQQQSLRLRIQTRTKELRQLGNHIQAWQNERRVLFTDLARKHHIAAFMREEEVADGNVYANGGGPCAHTECTGWTFADSPSSSYPHVSCTVCERFTCARCGAAILVPQDHVCDDDAQSTVDVMRRTTKPCPRCTVPIEKSHGCDQMWCTQCHFAFCWSTGKPLNPNALGFHNEHHAAHVATTTTTTTTTTLTTDDFRHLRAEILTLCHHSSHHVSDQGYALYRALGTIHELHIVVAFTLANHLSDLKSMPSRWVTTTRHSDPEHVWRQQLRFRRNWTSRMRLIRGTLTSKQFDAHLVRQHKRDRFCRALRTLCLTAQTTLVDIVRSHLLRLLPLVTTMFENNDHVNDNDDEIRSSLRESIARFDHAVHETEQAFRLQRPTVVIRWFERAERVVR